MSNLYDEISGPVQIYFVNKECLVKALVAVITEAFDHQYPDGFNVEGPYDDESEGINAVKTVAIEAAENFISKNWKG